MNARDWRRAALRGAIVVVAVDAIGVALGSDVVDPVWLVTSLFAGALVTGCALIELRATARTHDDTPNEPFLVWIAAALGAALLFLQGHYVAAVFTTRSFDRALGEVWVRVTSVGSPAQVAVGLCALSCPFALAAHVRLRGYEARSAVFVAAFVLLLPAGCMTLGMVFPTLGAAVLLLLWVYWLADVLEQRLFSGPSAAERDEAAALPHRQLWTLAYLDHAPARHALGPRAPDPPSDLEQWMLGLESAGRANAVAAAAVVAGLVVPFLEEARRDDATPRAVLKALDAWLADPSPAARDAARTLLDGWPPDEPAARALREAVFALEGEPPWATRMAVRSAARAAALAAHVMDGAAEVREAVRQALLDRILRGADARA